MPAAAYLMRRRFGYSACQTAEALGYRGHGGVASAITRIEAAAPRLKKTVTRLANELH